MDDIYLNLQNIGGFSSYRALSTAIFTAFQTELIGDKILSPAFWVSNIRYRCIAQLIKLKLMSVFQSEFKFNLL